MAIQRALVKGGGFAISEKILLGFEVPSGLPVYLTTHHLAIFGMTQLSGKTTALEALISRSGLKAIAFKTKRGEAGFTTYNLVTPYYKPRADWQFVEGLVNVALGEKVKYEPGMRYGIMKVCKGRKDLKEIQNAAKELAEKTKREFMKAVYEKLVAYLEIVIPELDKWRFSEQLELQEGINVMDLSAMRLETQHLVIASTIEYSFSFLDHVIVIIPEAWETIPQGKMTPVKWVAQQFIRKGAAIGNYLWLDSQDIGGIDKTPLRQCDNWLMGRMKEAHEVERILKQLVGLKVPKEEIQTLPLGHFYAAIGNEVKKVYALPAGVPEWAGKNVAMGVVTPEEIRDKYLKVKVMEDEDLIWKEKYEEEKRKREEIERTYTREVERVSDLKAQEKIEAFKQQFAENFVSREKLKEAIVHVHALEDEVNQLKKDAEWGRKFRELFQEIIPTPMATSIPTSAVPSMPGISIAEVDERINQRFKAEQPARVVSVDVNERVKELVKNDFVNRLIAKIQSLQEPAKKAALWMHEKKQANIKALFNYVYDRSEEAGRIPGTFYMNVVNPLQDAWLIIIEAGNVRWALEGKLAAELKDVLRNGDVDQIATYLSSLLI